MRPLVERDERCFLDKHSMDDYLQAVSQNIEEYGLHLVGVFSTDEPGPNFTYTIGLLESTGFELLVYGLPHEIAAVVLNQIGEHVRACESLSLDTPDHRFTNLPVKFVKCGPRAQEVNGMARRYHGADHVPMVQIVLCDRDGLFPDDPHFDHAYMDHRQPLL